LIIVGWGRDARGAAGGVVDRACAQQNASESKN
jgi:hypothetical protein